MKYHHLLLLQSDLIIQSSYFLPLLNTLTAIPFRTPFFSGSLFPAPRPN